MATTTAAPAQGSNPLPFLAALGLAIAGYFVAVNLTNAFGYGKDTHLLRIVAMVLPLFIGGAVAFWPGRGWQIRVGVLMVAITGAAVAWLLAPCELGGDSLADAVAKRNGVKSRIATPPTYDDAAKIEGIAKSMEFSSDYPTLAATVQPELNTWGTAAAEQIAERLRTATPTEAHVVDAAAEAGHRLRKQLPQTGEIIANAERDFSRRSADYWAEELEKTNTRYLSKLRDWVKRRDAVKSILPNGDRIAAAESAWIGRYVDESIWWLHHRRQFRLEPTDDALTASLELRSFITPTQVNPVPFRAERQRLFAASFAVTQTDVAKFLGIGSYDKASNVAHDFADRWGTEAEFLGSDTVRELESLRDGCGYLALLAKKVGYSAELAVPEPRTKPDKKE